MLKSIKPKINERNIGLQVLRMLLCLWVVLFHCLIRHEFIEYKYMKEKKFHVPSFFFLSFFYFYPVIKDRNPFKMKSRLERLFIPFIIWPTFIWLTNNIFYFFLKKSLFRREFLFKELIIQFITGRKFYTPLWFIFNLIFFSIFFFIISKILNETIFFIFMILIGIICYVFQYNRFIYNFFKNYTGCIAFSVGHFVTSFPIAITALTFNKINIIQYFEINRYKSLFIIFSILPIIFLNGIPNTYEGIEKNLFSLFAFIGFYLLPLNKYLNKSFKKFIYIITNYTNGIYCLHFIMYLFLKRLFKFHFSLFGCFLLYIICYTISFLGTKIFINYKIKYLFI